MGHRLPGGWWLRIGGFGVGAHLLVAAMTATAAVAVPLLPDRRAPTTSVVEIQTSRGLYPGAARDLVLVLDNTGAAPVTLAVDSIRVRPAQGRACPARYLSVRVPASHLLRVPARARGRVARVADAVRLGALAPDACQGAVFQVTVRLVERRR